jgi:hypothetical protein
MPGMSTVDAEEFRIEIERLRADWERFRGKMAHEFVAPVDEYRNVDEIRQAARREG